MVPSPNPPSPIGQEAQAASRLYAGGACSKEAPRRAALGERAANRRQAAGAHAAVDPQRRSAARLDPDAGVLTDPVSLAHVDLQADARIETPLEALHAKDLPANALAQRPEWAALPATVDAHDGAARGPNAEHANSRSPRQEQARDPDDREGRHQRRCRHIAVLWEPRAAFGRRRVLRDVEDRFVIAIIAIISWKDPATVEAAAPATVEAAAPATVRVQARVPALAPGPPPQRERFL